MFVDHEVTGKAELFPSGPPPVTLLKSVLNREALGCAD